MSGSVNSTSDTASAAVESPPPEKERGGLSRRAFMTAVGSTIAGGALAYGGLGATTTRPIHAADPTPRQGNRPNIILIITDQERYPQHWPEGWVQANLPARQRLAQNGLSFRRAFCNSAMCSASRSTLFTGLHPAQHGVVNTLSEGGTASPTEPTLPTDIQTMGKMLGGAGYNVVFKGKWHMSKGENGGDPTTEQVAAYGFNEWEPTAVCNDTKLENFGGGCANWDQRIADQAAGFLATQDAAGTQDDPFMLIVGLGNPHDVLAFPNTWDTVEEGGCNNYADFDFNQGIGLPANEADDLQNKPTCQLEGRNVAAALLGPLITPQAMTRYANFYAGLIKEVDGHVNTVLDAIPTEIRENTIVIYASDHGEMGMAHGGMRQKAFQMYEETVNVPLIVHNPTMFPTPRETDAYAALIDLMPTLATLAEVPNRADYTFFGTDLTPLLADSTTPVQNEILFTFDDIWAGNPNGAVVNPMTGNEVPAPPKNIRAIFTQDDTGEWKYARYFDPNEDAPPQFEMYQLRNGAGEPVDLLELDNLAHPSSANYDNPTIVAKRAALAQRLAALETERLQPLQDMNNIYLPLV